MKRFIDFLFISTFLFGGHCAIAQPPVQTKLHNNLQKKNDSIPNISEVPVSKPPSPVIDNSKFPVQYSKEKSTTIFHHPQQNGQAVNFNKQPHKGIKKKAHRTAIKGKSSKAF